MASMKRLNEEAREELSVRCKVESLILRREHALKTAVRNVCRKYDHQLLEILKNATPDLADRIYKDISTADESEAVVASDLLDTPTAEQIMQAIDAGSGDDDDDADSDDDLAESDPASAED